MLGSLRAKFLIIVLFLKTTAGLTDYWPYFSI